MLYEFVGLAITRFSCENSKNVEADCCDPGKLSFLLGL